jgi:hypothetical protein
MKKNLIERFATTKKCEQCGNDMTLKGLSMFSDKIICEACKEAEHELPEYNAECKAWLSHVKKLKD